MNGDLCCAGAAPLRAAPIVVPTPRKRTRLRLVAAPARLTVAEFAEAVASGLGHSPKTLPCRFFYDATGSRLFERICELPEYYLTRTEHEILDDCADEIAALFPRRTALVELGSGSSSKTRRLIEAFLKRHGALRYVPVDVSRAMLEHTADALLGEYPGLEILAIAAEYGQGLRRIRDQRAPCKLILWLGSSVGNYEWDQAAAFLREVRAAMQGEDRLLVGMDLEKRPALLERAYDDAAGVTARFNLNLLARINHELGGRFDLENFRHRALYDPAARRVDIHLVSTRRQTVPIAGLHRSIRFAAGEAIHTESCHKYSRADIDSLAAAAGLRLERQWIDRRGWFSVNLFAPACSS